MYHMTRVQFLAQDEKDLQPKDPQRTLNDAINMYNILDWFVSVQYDI